MTLRWPPAFAWGHVGGALVIGVAAGSVVDNGRAVWEFGGWMAGGALVSALVCWWWPGFAGRWWKLWPMAVLANPVFLIGLDWMWVDRACLLHYTGPWECMLTGIGPETATGCLPSPLLGLAARWVAGRSSAKAASSP